MVRQRRNALVLGLVLLLGLLGACAPSQGAPAAQSQVVPAPPRAPAHLTIAIARELRSFGDFTGGGGSGGGCPECRRVAHNYLVVQRDNGAYVPQLAVELPSVDRSTWQLNPDGSMDVTWRIPPNVKWQDGTPFTSDDLLFTFGLYKDPDLPSLYAGQLRIMESATAPDPYTFVVHWSRTYVNAHQAPALDPLPRHLLEELYRQGDKEAFANSPFFTTEFIGLGPYRLTRWDPGSAMELVRFDDYYRGRPPLERVTIQFIRDPNTMVANILAGAVDVVSPPSVDLGTALNLQRQWAGTGHQVRTDLSGMLMQVMIQHRPELAMPRNALSNRTVRQALYHATDRQAVSAVMTESQGPVADSWFAPNDPLRPQVEQVIPQYPLDPARAQRLLAQEGWVRGPEGGLIHQPSAERFELELWARGGFNDRPVSVIADAWKPLGVQTAVSVIPAARANDRDFEATLAGAVFSNPPADQMTQERLHSSYIASAANRWTGRNLLGYSNPRVDAILDRLQTTIDPREQVTIHRELLQEAMGDAAFIPLYWDVVPILMLKGVTGPTARNVAWNIFEWDKTP